MQPATINRSLAEGPRQTGHRVSLACLPCRSRHIRCNAAKPICSRCSSDGTSCIYTRSRRHGNRRRNPDNEIIARESPTQTMLSPSILNPFRTSDDHSILNVGADSSSHRGLITSTSAPSRHPSAVVEGIETFAIDEDLIGLYYTYFHAAHPCVLPRWALRRYYESNAVLFMPIVLVIQYIGSIFDLAIDSELHRKIAKQALPLSPNYTNTLRPHDIQAMLLYSMAVYWCDEIDEGIDILSRVTKDAIELGMHLESFVMNYGCKDPLLEESWRRTWWQIYVTEGNIAGSTHTFPTRVYDIKMSALLPCEEEYYESGDISTSRTLKEYDMREFLPDDESEFSSFAHHVGLARTIDSVLSHNIPIERNIASICTQLDIGFSAWCSLLPRSKRCLMSSDREIDMQLFKANMLINTYVVDLHRRLSDLAYFEVESVARCAPPPPPANLRCSRPGETRLHTSKALLAIQKIGELLPMPSTLITHTPFLICMIANTMVAHLSACRYLFKGHALQLERERIRLRMGALRVLGECWPLGKRTYREMGIIAREILGLLDRDIPRAPSPLRSSPIRVSPGVLRAQPEPLVSDMFAGMDLSYLNFCPVSQDLSSCDIYPAAEDTCL